MSGAISKSISDRVCQHMNEDHIDALVLYAQVYGNVEDASAAQMQAIDSHGMDLNVQVYGGAAVPVRINFNHPLKDAEDAHHTLIEMVKQAKAKLRSVSLPD
jgi:putative heme iron utilization protein